MTAPASSAATSQRRQLTSALVGIALFVGAGSLIVLASPRNQAVGWVFINLALFYVFIVVATVAHELGHAAASRLVGVGVSRIIIGTGKTLWETKLFNIPTTLKMFVWGGGLTFMRYPTLRWIRFKTAVSIAAGPVTNLGIVVLLVSLLEPKTAQGPFPEGSGLYPIFVFMAANVLAFGISLFPGRSTTEYGVIENDGLQLVRLPWRSKEEFASCVAHHFSLLAFERGKTKDYAGAREAALEGLRVPGIPPLFRASLLNQAAWYALLLGQADLLKEAEAQATEALKLAPHDTGTKGTLGSVLIELGKYERGIELLEESNAAVERDEHRATNLCYVAVAHRRMGDVQKAVEILREVATLDSNCELLDRAQQAIG